MGIFSNLRKQADDNVGIPDVDAWLNEDGDVAIEDALPDLPPPPQAPEMEERRAPAPPLDDVVPSGLPMADDNPLGGSDESDGGLWNLPDFDENIQAESASAPDLAPPSPSLPSIAEIAQGIPPAGSGLPTPDSLQGFAPTDGLSHVETTLHGHVPSTGFEGLSQAVGANGPGQPSADLPPAPATDSSDVRWDLDVVKYEPEVPAALQATEPGRIPMPVIPPAGMSIDDQPELPADSELIPDTEIGAAVPAPSADEPLAPMAMPVIPPVGLDALEAPGSDVGPAWAVGTDNTVADGFSDTDFGDTDFGDTNFADTNFADSGNTEADFSGADFSDADFTDSNFTDSNFADTELDLADRLGESSSIGSVPDQATTDEGDAGFSLSNIFGRKKSKTTDADGFADLYEPVADDPFGDNVGLGNTEAPGAMAPLEAFDAPTSDIPLLDAPLLDAPTLDAPMLDAPTLDETTAPVELDAIEDSLGTSHDTVDAFAGETLDQNAFHIGTDFSTESPDTASFDTETFAGESFEANAFDGDALGDPLLGSEPLSDDAFGEISPSELGLETPAAPAWETADLDEIAPDLSAASTESIPSETEVDENIAQDASGALDLTEAAPDAPAPQPSVLVIPSLNEMSLANLEMPAGPQAAMLLEILGLSDGATWEEARDARRVLVAEHNPHAASDDERAALAKAICREMNTAYAALRLLQVP